MKTQQTLYAMLQESLTTESPMNKFRSTLADDEKSALDHLLHTAAGGKPFVESTSEMSSLEAILLLTALRQSQKIDRLELLLQRLTIRVLELYAAGERVPEQQV